MRFFNKKKWNTEVAPDEIFLDSKNLPEFNKQQMEGRLEKPISKNTLLITGLFFIFIISIFLFKITRLQITNGQDYFNLAENNSLDKELIFADRGIIYDRNHVALAWNTIENTEKNKKSFLHRSYIESGGFGHVLGYVGYPTKDQAGFYWQKEFIGKDGIEKVYNSRLNGKNGLKIFETDAMGEIQSENIIVPPVHGESLVLTIDSRVQTKLYEYLKSFAEKYKFIGGTSAIMDLKNGDIIALTNYPEYDSEILSSGNDQEMIKQYLVNKQTPFLNRAVQGLYTPGSILKPIVALGALNENIIDPLKKILSIGYINIPNKYFPDKPTRFNDWKAHGWIDMKQAIAQSSDVYFYEIGGGFEDQKGLGISNIEKYSKMFGINSPTGIDLPGEKFGVVPTPNWKHVNFPNDDWRIGDTYNTAIGQYGFQVTPIEVLRVAAALGDDGLLIKPHMIVGDDNISNIQKINIPKDYFDVVHEGMRKAVTEGTASRLNLPFVKVSAKTGTAQVGYQKQFVNSWVIGFFPSDEPRYAFMTMVENGPSTNAVSVSLIMNQLLTWMNGNAPEYFN